MGAGQVKRRAPQLGPHTNRFRKRGRGQLNLLLEETLANCQDEVAGLYSLEATEVERLISVLAKYEITTAHTLEIRLARERRYRGKERNHARND